MIRQANQYRFYKVPEQGWFIDLPEYLEAGGEQEDLAMVLGADDLLDYLSDNTSEVTLEISASRKELWHSMEKTRNNPTGEGCTYIYDTGTDFIIAWLCPVTLFIFDEYPNKIYFKIVQ